MPTHQEILTYLTRNELLALAERLDISIDTRARKGDLLESLAKARPTGLRALLPNLSRDRLKELCRKLSLDDGGRDKAEIVSRLVSGRVEVNKPQELALFAATPTARAASVGTRRKSRSAPSRGESKAGPPPIQKLPMSDPPTNSIDLSELESHLWEAANILRGSPVDRTDWKSYILPLLFFKRICDVWDEEHASMLAEYGEDYADEHRFQVPDGALILPHFRGHPTRRDNAPGVIHGQAGEATEAA